MIAATLSPSRGRSQVLGLTALLSWRQALRWTPLVVLLTAGCAALGPAPPPFSSHLQSASGQERTCAQLFDKLDAAMRESQVQDAQAARLPGYPYLRADRFLASFAGMHLDDSAFDDWVSRMQDLARQGWNVELANLPPRRSLPDRSSQIADGDRDTLAQDIAACGTRLRDMDLGPTAGRERLREHVRVPSDYVTWERVLGLYPLTALVFAHGIERWHEETRRTFTRPVSGLPVHGRLLRFVPPLRPQSMAAEIAAILERSARNPLAIPDPDEQDRERLFAAFAPSFEMDVAGRDDLIGSPRWSTDPVPQIDTARPVVYRLISHTRIHGKVLLQLNYVVWFPARPRSSGLDLLGGHIDGLVWRVTLGPDGLPLAYDSIHNCGCYHLFFPTSRLRPKPPPQRLEESAFVPEQAPSLDEPQGLTLYLASASHYLERVLARSGRQAQTVAYDFSDYDELRSLSIQDGPIPDGGRRSLFGEDSIVSGTERGERWLFWPMGVPDPGAMRQWGHHATAFVGRRHFDDPDLLERYFELVR